MEETLKSSFMVAWQATKGGPVFMGFYQFLSFTGYYKRPYTSFHYITAVLLVLYLLRYEKLVASKCMY